MIQLRQLTLRRGAKVVLDQANVTINPGEKVALVGRNGAGKSSLFALMQGHLQEDSGTLDWPQHWRLSQVAQDMPETDEPATDFVVAGDTRLMQARAAVAQAEAAGDGLSMAEAYTALHDAGDHDAQARAQSLLMGLGFHTHQLMEPVNSFSGGWRMRLQLARALMCPSDVLMLDEPTNHLDLDALVWLESWLQRYDGTLLVISHDREFLDSVTQVTLHIDNARLTRYGGNYSRFETMRAEQMSQQQVAFSRQQDKVAQLQRFIDRFKAKASKAKQAQSRVKALERMERIAPVLADAEFNFSFDEGPQPPNPMLAMRDASVGYHLPTGEAKAIVEHITRSVMAGQRLGILGANGQGKSTLVKTIAGALPLLSGSVTPGKGLVIGYFAQQELDVLSLDDHPLQHMIRLARDAERAGTLSGQSTKEQDLRNFLGRFQFSGDMVMQAVGSMSGGEKARLVLCMLVWQRPNLLLLDEPTNHLDLATREALAMALNEFEGSVLLVSHDRALLRTVCDEFWLVAQGAVSPFDGDLDDYQRYLLDQAKAQRVALATAAKQEALATKAAQTAQQAQAAQAALAAQAAKHEQQASAHTPPPDSGLNPAEQRKQQAAKRQQLAQQLKPFKQEAQTIEQRLGQLQQEQAALHAQMMQPASPQELADAGRRLKTVDDDIQQLEARWLELLEHIEQLEGASA